MTPAEIAEQREAEGKCIICNTPADPRIRGLCERHRGRFKSALAKISPEKRADFEADLIARGMLLPNRKGQKLRPEDDEFAVARERFLAQQLAADLEKSPEEVEAELERQEPVRPQKGQRKKGHT